MTKERIDILLVERGLAPSRERAQAYIMAGSVLANGEVCLKSGTKFGADVELIVTADPIKFVSRGGLKLEAALDCWDIDLTGKVSVDIGASTGGFTDLMLRRGAAKVYAIDVGYGQLDYKLRIDERVVNMERTNVRYLDTDVIREAADFISIDVSFISLKHIFPVAARLLRGYGKEGVSGTDETEEGKAPPLCLEATSDDVCAEKDCPTIVALVKPQFEARREQVGKGGIIRDEKIHEEVLDRVSLYAEQNNLVNIAVISSPITGTKGNKEFLMWLK